MRFVGPSSCRPCAWPQAKPGPGPRSFWGSAGSAARSSGSCSRSSTNGSNGGPKSPPCNCCISTRTPGRFTKRCRAIRPRGSRPTRCSQCRWQPSQEYREDSTRLLKWLNRRWLYNVPRSLQTEGIRPLGRLAYVDHCSQGLGPHSRCDYRRLRRLGPNHFLGPHRAFLRGRELRGCSSWRRCPAAPAAAWRWTWPLACAACWPK